jgi:hypothetical protein
MLAAVHEYGSPKRKIPERSFLRSWAAEKQAGINKMIALVWKRVSGAEWKAENALKTLGQFGEDGVKSQILALRQPPLADATIKAKGSSKPLIDTAQNLLNRIRYKIFFGGKVPQ